MLFKCTYFYKDLPLNARDEKNLKKKKNLPNSAQNLRLEFIMNMHLGQGPVTKLYLMHIISDNSYLRNLKLYNICVEQKRWGMHECIVVLNG